MKRVFVVLLLYMFGKRTATAYNFFGLALCTLGLLLYAWDKHRKLSTRQDTTEDTACKHRRVPWILLMVTLGSFAAVFGAFLTTPGISIYLKSSESTPFHQCIASQPPHIINNKVTFLIDPFTDLTFGAESLKRPEDGQLMPDLLGYLANNSADIKSFLERHLLEDSERAGYLSSKLKTSFEVIKEAQRIHYNMFNDVIGKYKYGILFDIADTENNGDSAITVGDILFIAHVSTEIIYYCNTLTCSKSKNMNEAYRIAQSYSPQEIIILLHGGGNINGYRQHDFLRVRIFNKFKGYKFIVFPQSIWVKDTGIAHFKLISSMYCCNENLTMILRDKTSFRCGKVG